jgi:hypothetical protein
VAFRTAGAQVPEQTALSPLAGRKEPNGDFDEGGAAWHVGAHLAQAPKGRHLRHPAPAHAGRGARSAGNEG